MKIQFLSVCGWRPDREEEDTVSLLIDDQVQIDTGWHCVRNLLRAGKSPEDVRLLLFSHMHQDHYLSLPAFLFYLLNSRHDASTATVMGPERLEEVVEQSLALAGKHLHYAACPGPAVRRLRPGESIEHQNLRIDTCASSHAVPGLCYRLTDRQSGASAAYSGDTAYSEELVCLARGCDVLIHEQSRGPSARADAPNASRHSSAQEAARCAKAAGVGRLYLVHASSDNREESLQAARAIFPESYRPQNLESILL